MNKLSVAKAFIGIILVLLLLMTALYTKCLTRNYLLMSNLNSWVKLAASTSAYDDFATNQRGFYEINMTVKNKTIIGSREGYPIRAWAFQRDNEGCNQKFVDDYNVEMEKLIDSANNAK
jgi:hypothetical protein